MGKISYPSAAECRKADAIATKLRKHYADNWRVNLPRRFGGLTINIVLEKRHALHAKVKVTDWFTFTGTVAEEVQRLIGEVDAVLAEIANRPLFRVVWSTDGKGNITDHT